MLLEKEKNISYGYAAHLFIKQYNVKVSEDQALIFLYSQEFPPASKLDPKLYGKQSSTISEEHIINSLDGFTISEVKLTQTSTNV